MYCRPKKVTESELLKVILNPRELIELKNKIAKKEARKALNIVESDDSDEDQEDGELIITLPWARRNSQDREMLHHMSQSNIFK